MKHYFEKTTGKHFGSVSIGGIDVPPDAVIIENELSYKNPIVFRNGVIVEQIQQVTMAQARVALIEKGLIDQVELALSSISDDKERAKAMVWWEYAQTVDRNNPIVKSLVATLGINDEQLDELFLLASH